MTRQVFFKKGSRMTKQFVMFTYASTGQLQLACVAAGVGEKLDPKTPLYEALKSGAPTKYHRAMLTDELKKRSVYGLMVGSHLGLDTAVGVTEEEWKAQLVKAN